MPKELDPERFAAEIAEVLSDDQREWLARMLHDYVSGSVANIAMHVEIVKKMVDRDMAIKDEVASLKSDVSAITQQIVMIEKIVRPKHDDEETV